MLKVCKRMREQRMCKRMREQRGMEFLLPHQCRLIVFFSCSCFLSLYRAGSETLTLSPWVVLVCVWCVSKTTDSCCSSSAGRYLFLNAIANQLRYPNSHTHYFSCTMLYLFAEANTEAIQEQITRWEGIQLPAFLPCVFQFCLGLTVLVFGFQGSLGTTDCK